MNKALGIEEIRVPSIVVEGEELKGVRTYEIDKWNHGTLTGNEAPTLGIEIEGITVNGEGTPVLYSEGKFTPITRTKPPTLEQSDEGIAQLLKDKAQMFRDNIARATHEMYLPTMEVSFNNGGQVPLDFFPELLKTLKQVDEVFATKGVSFLPHGIQPIKTPNIPNLTDPYYHYLHFQRDGVAIADFRGSGVQLHKEMEDKNLAIFVFNHIRYLLPYFLMLSANSPISNGVFRGNVSERTISKSVWQMTGIPGAIDENFYTRLQQWLDAGLRSVTPYYYAVRYPRVDIKTIENASMDSVADIGIMTALVDIYYRVTEKLKQAYYQQKAVDGHYPELPEKLFGNYYGDAIETEHLKKIFLDTARSGTHLQFHIFGQSSPTTYTEYTKEILTWIGDIPSIFPPYIAKALNIPENTDATQYVLSQVLSEGNLAQRIIREMGLKTPQDSVEGITVPVSDIKQMLLAQAQAFAGQVRNIILP